MAQSSLPDPTTDADQQTAIGLAWFLRRELVTIPLLIVVVGVLLAFGIGPATLLFVALLAIVVLGFIWSGITPIQD